MFVMRSNLLFIFILLVIIGGAAYLILQIDQSVPEESDGIATPNTWEWYTSEVFDFQIAHNPNAEVTREAGNNVKFMVLGPDAKKDTEITDGYVVTVSSHNKVDYGSLRDLAEERAESVRNIGDVIRPITQTTFKEQISYTFTSQTIGPVVDKLFTAGDDFYYHISYSAVDPNNSGYEDEVNTMLTSFTALDGDDGPPVVTSALIAFLDREGESDGKERGCDRVMYLRRDIEPTTAPLNGVLEELFSIEEEVLGKRYNFIARTHDTLSFDRAEITEDSVAKIYLSGELSGLAGVCDNPRAKIQIEETALVFDSVDEVEIYLNGSLTELQPSGRGE